MDSNTTRETKVLKVRYYLTLFAEVELEIPEGKDEDEAVRVFLPDVPANKFNVLTADFAEVEDEEQGKRCIKLD
jgi:hypothetical protein